MTIYRTNLPFTNISRMTCSGRLSPLPATSTIGIPDASYGRLLTVPGRLENNYLIII